MPEIERERGTKFKRVARSRDVVQVQLRGAINQPLHGFGIEVAQLQRIALDRVEKSRVPYDRDFYGFDITGPFVARRQRRKHLEIVDDRERHREGADEILLAERIDAVLYAHTGIILAQGGGGNA